MNIAEESAAGLVIEGNSQPLLLVGVRFCNALLGAKVNSTAFTLLSTVGITNTTAGAKKGAALKSWHLLNL